MNELRKGWRSLTDETALALKKRCEHKKLSNIGLLHKQENACNLFQRERSSQHLHRNAIFCIIQYVGPKFWPFCSLCNGVISKERENWLLYRCGNTH